ncbi:DUF6415 family natural product biosynthesis protein [Streptomyces sp. Mg1]|uniref:DUF6415 family natural product biosynthesis protein n=1 Tax=Streptomyces sp. Mg1 TaxID=465541 RepID=UPI00017E9D2E|nr:DUF6415 family natural product biosynthesis protein [Streptomyces sp. Mg1]EDX20917.1 hypothetical protein SSAG_00708 [Streptomyces sp. Mg1]
MTYRPPPRYPVTRGEGRTTPEWGQVPGTSRRLLPTPAPAPPLSSAHIALYDPEGHLDGEFPLDRASHERMVKAVLGWPADPGLRPADLEQITLLLTGAAHAVADDVRHAAGQLTDGHTARTLAAAVLAEARHRLAAAPQDTVACAQGRARLVRTLYEHLDHLTLDFLSSLDLQSRHG